MYGQGLYTRGQGGSSGGSNFKLLLRIEVVGREMFQEEGGLWELKLLGLLEL